MTTFVILQMKGKCISVTTIDGRQHGVGKEEQGLGIERAGITSLLVCVTVSQSFSLTFLTYEMGIKTCNLESNAKNCMR